MSIKEKKEITKMLVKVLKNFNRRESGKGIRCFRSS